MARLLYRARSSKHLSATRRNSAPALALLAATLALGTGGCSMSSHLDMFSGPAASRDITGSLRNARAQAASPTESDLAFARNAASDVLSRGSKDASQPWENPETGARGSVTPLASAYTVSGRTCRDFLASYVQGSSEAWMQGAACKSTKGQWEIRDMTPWRRS